MDDPVVTGWCDPAFAAVRDEFSANFRERGELGAAVCVTVRGTTVASLHGGWADWPGRRPWAPDTLVNVFSVGKGLIAACLARLTGAGLLDPDAAVTRYWPQFGAAGKQDVTVRQLLSHQAGLPALHAAMPAGSMLDFDRMVAVLAAEEPWWQPGSGHGYHVNTFGFLAGQLIRLVTGLLPGEYLTRELAGPLGADVHIGLRPGQQRRVADFHWADGPSAGSPASGAVPDYRMTVSAYFNPPDFSGRGLVNTVAWRSAQLPSANAHASAAGIARMYSALAAGGTADGMTVVDSGALAEATRQQAYGDDLVLRRPSRFGLGFQLTHPERQLGGGPRCFGHFGAGGSVGFADPDAQLGFGYVTNQMGPRWRNPRNKALMDAVYASL
jgi:CubicO group peptidase (beta-lactamase class C family)